MITANDDSFLSDKITKSAERIIEQWKKSHPEESLLNIAQQSNLAGTNLKKIGAALEEQFKSAVRGRTTNELH